jgi:hypothetical protein
VIVFLSVALALKIGERIGGFGGFAIVAGFYLLVGAGLAVYRDALTKKVEKKVSAMFDKKKK